MTNGDLVIDSTFDKQPASFVMGDGSLLPGFENKLLGLRLGDEKTFVLSSAEAFGEINPDSIHSIDQGQFKNMDLGGNELSEGLMVSFEGAGKRPMPGVVKKIDGDQVIVDFNHPLAGQTVIFKVKIIQVEAAPAERMIRVTNT
jgi:FKBP-type peptidyl-prolyl cis-trans isomerase SlpA